MARYVALLRAVNLGPARRVPMAELRALLDAAGYADVRTHGQSGNVLLDADAGPDALAADLRRHIAGAFGLDAPVLVRTAEELAAVVADDPLAGVADDPRRRQVLFLSAPVDPARARELEAAAEALAPERVVVRGRELHTWHPDGIQRSPLNRLLSDAKLGVTATARNWNTVTRLVALAGAGPE